MRLYVLLVKQKGLSWPLKDMGRKGTAWKHSMSGVYITLLWDRITDAELTLVMVLGGDGGDMVLDFLILPHFRLVQRVLEVRGVLRAVGVAQKLTHCNKQQQYNSLSTGSSFETINKTKRLKLVIVYFNYLICNLGSFF